MPKCDPKTAYDILSDNINIEDFHEYAEEFVVRPPYQRKIGSPKTLRVSSH